MPQGRPNSYAGGGFIKSMREKHEPHMKLAGRVEGLEKSIPIALAGIHKTSSKSFGLQRKTLMRVIALEKKVSGITIIIEGLEDAAAELQASGYASDPKYGEMALAIARGRTLRNFLERNPEYK